MTSDSEILAIKQDMRLLLQTLQLSRATNHNPCPSCKDASGLSVFVRRESQEANFKCHRCDFKGSIFEALKILNGLSFGDAIKYIKGSPDIRLSPAKKQEYIKNAAERPVPVMDKSKCDRMIIQANEFLLENMHYCAEFKRGLSREVVEKYRIGLLYNVGYRIYDYGAPYHFNASWVIPVTDDEGQVNGIKLHHQIKPLNGKGQEHPAKCTWAPFGTEPRENRDLGIQPVHSYYTLWPHPETFTVYDPNFSIDPTWWVNQIDMNSELFDRWNTALYAEQASIAYALGINTVNLSPINIYQAFQNTYANMGKEVRKSVQAKMGRIKKDREEPVDPDSRVPDFENYIFITPGELKALALISEGYMATAVTGGESWLPPRALLESLRGQRICLFWDNDVPTKPKGKNYWICAGRTWAAKMTTALRAARVKEIVSICGGQKVVGMRPKKEPEHGAQEETFEV